MLDILVLEKNHGTVRRVINGNLLPVNLLEIACIDMNLVVIYLSSGNLMMF